MTTFDSPESTFKEKIPLCENVIFEEGVTEIPQQFFSKDTYNPESDNRELKNLTFKGNLSIGSFAFYNNDKLEQIVFEGETKFLFSEDGTPRTCQFANCFNLKEVTFKKNTIGNVREVFSESGWGYYVYIESQEMAENFIYTLDLSLNDLIPMLKEFYDEDAVTRFEKTYRIVEPYSNKYDSSILFTMFTRNYIELNEGHSIKLTLPEDWNNENGTVKNGRFADGFFEDYDSTYVFLQKVKKSMENILYTNEENSNYLEGGLFPDTFIFSQGNLFAYTDFTPVSNLPSSLTTGSYKFEFNHYDEYNNETYMGDLTIYIQNNKVIKFVVENSTMSELPNGVYSYPQIVCENESDFDINFDIPSKTFIKEETSLSTIHINWLSIDDLNKVGEKYKGILVQNGDEPLYQENGDYTVTDGSVMINLSKKYLDSLPVGTHNIKVYIKQNGEAKTDDNDYIFDVNVIINAKSAPAPTPTPEPSNPGSSPRPGYRAPNTGVSGAGTTILNNGFIESCTIAAGLMIGLISNKKRKH